eukprot:766690-Hanusia_phi.AAC.6
MKPDQGECPHASVILGAIIGLFDKHVRSSSSHKESTTHPISGLMRGLGRGRIWLEPTIRISGLFWYSFSTATV